MKYKLYKKEDLRKRLESLTGEDFTKAEESARLDGDKSLDILTSRRFFAAVAAVAYKKPIEDIQALPIREYTAITGDVGSFLLVPDTEEEPNP